MKHISACPVCLEHQFSELFPSTYSGTAEQAAVYFLTDRKTAVHGRIVRCAHCGFVLTSPQFDADEYEQIYREVAAIEPPPGRGSAISSRYRSLASSVKSHAPTGRFFDFGCGDGHFIDVMSGFDGTGLDLRATSQGVQVSGDSRIVVGELYRAIAGGLLKAASFDFITMWDVIEHLPRLTEDIAALRGLLRPRGFLFCSAPNVASFAARFSGERWNCYLLEHLWYFSPATLTAFLERQGFARRAVRPFLFPADLATLASRVRQTYGVNVPLPRAVESLVVPVPAGVMFGVFQLEA